MSPPVSNAPVGAQIRRKRWPLGHGFTLAGVCHPAALASSRGHCAPGSSVKGEHILGATPIALTPICLKAFARGVVLS